MSLKTKLTSCIIAFMMIMSVLVVGVWALKTTNFTVGGNITFKTKGIQATITDATLTGATTTDNTTVGSATRCKDIIITENTTEENIEADYETWQGLALQFSETTATLTFTITNTKPETEDYPYMSVEVSISHDSIENADIQVTNTNGGNKIYLASGASAEYTISFYLNDKTADASISGFKVDFAMERMLTDPTESAIQLSYQAQNGKIPAYYYVNMGKSGTTDLRWRLVSFDGVNAFKATKTTPPKMYTPITGDSAYKNATFILQEGLTLYKEFDVNYTTNNYAASPIRTYLRSTGTGTMYADYSMSGTVWNKISQRTIGDLHNDIGWALSYDGTTVPNEGGEATYAPPTGTKPNGIYDTTYTTSTSDKLWLMSVKEIYTLVGGGRVIDNTIPYTWSEEVRENLIWRQNSTSTEDYGEYYWLRSPNPGNSDYAFGVDNYGAWSDDYVGYAYAVRPAFNLNF